jgi:hypothetical protein
MNVMRNPLTPALSPFWRGEGDGARFECLTLSLNRTRKCGLVKRLNGLTELNEFNGLKVMWLDRTLVESVSVFFDGFLMCVLALVGGPYFNLV